MYDPTTLNSVGTVVLSQTVVDATGNSVTTSATYTLRSGNDDSEPPGVVQSVTVAVGDEVATGIAHGTAGTWSVSSSQTGTGWALYIGIGRYSIELDNATTTLGSSGSGSVQDSVLSIGYAISWTYSGNSIALQ